MNEVELCPDCYLNSCIRKNDEWFSETCVSLLQGTTIQQKEVKLDVKYTARYHENFKHFAKHRK